MSVLLYTVSDETHAQRVARDHWGINELLLSNREANAALHRRYPNMEGALILYARAGDKSPYIMASGLCDSAACQMGTGGVQLYDDDTYHNFCMLAVDVVYHDIFIDTKKLSNNAKFRNGRNVVLVQWKLHDASDADEWVARVMAEREAAGAVRGALLE